MRKKVEEIFGHKKAMKKSLRKKRRLEMSGETVKRQI